MNNAYYKLFGINEKGMLVEVTTDYGDPYNGASPIEYNFTWGNEEERKEAERKAWEAAEGHGYFDITVLLFRT